MQKFLGEVLKISGEVESHPREGAHLPPKSSLEFCSHLFRLKKIAVCSLSMKTNRLYLGTEGGNIYLLDINTFDLLDHIIYQDVVIQG